MHTLPCNLYPLEPHFYIVKLGFIVFNIGYLISILKHGHSVEHLNELILKSIFSENKEILQFLYENFQYLQR